MTEPKKPPAKKVVPKKPVQKKEVVKRVKTGGRVTLLTPERQEVILDALKTGCYVETACLYAGVATPTVYHWFDRGRRERERLALSEHGTPLATEVIYLDFLEAVEKARAEAELRAVAQIQKAASLGTWQASAWYLERSSPKRWGRKDYSEITGEDGGAIRIEVSTDELERKIMEIASKRNDEIVVID
jgi:hypothetical protein